MTRSSKYLESIAILGLTVHAAFTVFDNLPDAGRPLANRIRLFGPLPQWRFFAPNPGIENFHLFYRTESSASWSAWIDISMKNSPTWSSWIWNPFGRSPKVLFDATQQLLIAKSSGATYEWILQTEPYALLKEIVENIVNGQGATRNFQFMILSALPEAGEDGFRPLLVSEVFPTQPASNKVCT